QKIGFYASEILGTPVKRRHRLPCACFAASATWTKAQYLHIVTAMRHLTLLLLLLPFSALLAAGQEPVASINPQGIVDSFEISGVPEGDISPTLRGTMQKLVGAKFDQQATEAVVEQIEIDLPGFIATTRLVPSTVSDRIKVIFVIERIKEEAG